MRFWTVMLRLGACLAALGVMAGAQAQGTRAVVDPQTATVTDARLAAGVPLGGLGTGKVELLTDGNLGNLTLNNNWDRPIAELPGSFFAVRARKVGDTAPPEARVLALRSPYALPAVAGVRYQGLFPRADLQYTDPALPVDVALQAYSVLIPHNLKDSSLPAATFTFTLTNSGSAPVETTLAFSWENVLGRGGDAKAEWDDRTGNTQDVKVDGARAGLVFKTSQQRQGTRQNSLGDYAVLAEAEGGKVVVLPSWNAAGDGRDFWSAFTAPAPFGVSTRVLTGNGTSIRPAGAVAATVNVPAEGKAQVHFILAWNTPHLVTPDGTDHGHAYSEHWPDAWSAAAYAAQYRETLLSGTAEWQDLLQRSTVPSWLRARLANDLLPLVSNSLYTRDGAFTLRESAEPGAGLGALDQWLLFRTAVASLYPELDAAELKRFAAVQGSAGDLPRHLGTLNTGFGTAPTPERNNWPDVACNYVLAVYRQYRGSGDLETLKAALPSVARAVEWLKSRDADGDGIPEGGSTWTYRHYPGTFSYTASLYLATLRAAEAMAKAASDRKLEEDARARLATARDTAMAQLWNGRFFTKYLDPETAQRSTNLFAGALAGEWAGEQLGLADQYDPRVVDTGLRSLLELLLAPSGYTPPNELDAEGSLAPGLSDVSWQGHVETYVGALGIARGRADAGLNAVYRFHDVQYAVTRSPWEAVLGYNPRTGQRTGPRDHVSQMASWNVYQALAGVTLDAPAGILTVAPSLPTASNGLKGPLFAPRSWSWIDYSRNPLNAATHLRLKLLKKFDERPELLNGVATAAPAGAKLDELKVVVTGPAGAIPGRADLKDGRLVYTFKQPVEWHLSETLELSIVPPDANNVVIAFGRPTKVYSYGSQVLAKNVEAESDIRYTLVNPTKQRQVVNVRFRNAPDKTYEVFLNGAPQPRFVPTNEETRLTLTVPASPIEFERVEVLRDAATRLQAARDQASAAGVLTQVEAPLTSLQNKLKAAVEADDAARSAQVLMHPYRTNLILRNKLKEPPAVIAPADPEPAVTAAEAALAEAPRQFAQAAQDPAARRIVMSALFPAQVGVAVEGLGEPGTAVKLRVSVANQGRRPLRAAGELELPAGWGGPINPRLIVPAGETASLEIESTVAATAEPKRGRVAGRVLLSAEGVSWDVPVSVPVGHAFVREWSVIGAWPGEGTGALDVNLPPDVELDPAKSYDGRRWHLLRAPEGRVDLAREFPGSTPGVAFALTQVFSPTEQQLFLEAGADGPWMARLNGDIVIQHREAGKAAPGQERVPIRLRQGWNTLVLKLVRASPTWGFYAEITDKDRGTPGGLRLNPSLGQ